MVAFLLFAGRYCRAQGRAPGRAMFPRVPLADGRDQGIGVEIHFISIDQAACHLYRANTTASNDLITDGGIEPPFIEETMLQRDRRLMRPYPVWVVGEELRQVTDEPFSCRSRHRGARDWSRIGRPCRTRPASEAGFRSKLTAIFPRIDELRLVSLIA